MSLLLANLLIRFIPCSIDYKDKQDFIGMDMARKFLEMGFTRSVGMQIILVEKSMLKMVPLDPNRQMHYTVKKRGLLEFLKK